MSNNYKDDSSTHAFRKEFNRQKEDLIAYVTLKRYLNSQNEMINNLIKKMNNSKKDKKKQEMEFLKHKLQSLESKILMKSLERNQLDFLSSMKKGYFN